MKSMMFKIAALLSLVLTSTLASRAQQTATSADQDSNIQTYTDLLRSDVKTEKVQIIGVMLQLSPEQAAKFWPIYSSYDGQLRAIDDRKLAMIQDYAANYNSMTDAKADELVERSIDLVSQRNTLLKQTYEQVRAGLGAKEAARFIQVENQLLMIIDLQIASQLPSVK
jgi:hypothetical protein